MIGSLSTVLAVSLLACSEKPYKQREVGTDVTGDWAWFVKGDETCDSVNLVKLKIYPNKIDGIDNRNFAIRYSDIESIEYKNSYVYIRHSIYKYSNIIFDDGKKLNAANQYFLDSGTSLVSKGFVIEGIEIDNSELNVRPMILKKCD